MKDAIVDEVRKVRAQIMAECGDDASVYWKHLKDIETTVKSKVVTRGPKRIIQEASASPAK